MAIINVSPTLVRDMEDLARRLDVASPFDWTGTGYSVSDYRLARLVEKALDVVPERHIQPGPGQGQLPL